MTIRQLGSLLAMTCLFVGACGDDDEDSGSTYQSSCANGCTAANKCSSTVDIETCSADCEADQAEMGPNLRADYLAELDACISEATCAELNANAFLDFCGVQARAALAASDTLTAFCNKVDEQDTQCSRFPNRGAYCVEFMKMFSDEALARAQDCLELSCDLQEDCVDEELGTNFGGDNP